MRKVKSTLPKKETKSNVSSFQLDSNQYSKSWLKINFWKKKGVTNENNDKVFLPYKNVVGV